MRRHSHRALVAALLLVLLGALPAAASPAVDPVRAERERVLRYWTAERMASAIPRDFVRIPGGFAPAAKPPGTPGGGGGGGGGGSTGNVTGKSWNGGGKILAASGKVFFRMGNNNYQCSGSVASDSRNQYSLVLTAAHCAYDEVAKAFATNWVFIPEWDSAPTATCSNTKWGCWNATAIVVHSGYATAGGFNSQATVHDFAFVVVGGGGKTAGATLQLDATVGSFSVSYTNASAGDRLYAFGYPAAGKYKGNDLVYCAGPIFEDPYNDKKTWGMNCDMTGGSSGGPWLSTFSEATGSGTLSSLNSYGYSGVKAMHGPKFTTDKAKVVYDKANSTTSNAIVP